MKVNDLSPPKLVTLVYCFRGDEVLLLHRRHPPFAGRWIAPGGKLQSGESPRQCADREFTEETGLVAKQIRLRGIVTETSPSPDWQWLIFVYVASELEGVLTSDEREGELRWWKVADLAPPLIPDSDVHFLACLLDSGQEFFEMHLEYDSRLELQAIELL